MGFLSKITKPFKKIWKGIKKVAKKAWTATKKFVKSKVGKLIIAAAIIYFTMGAGTAALGGASTGASAAAGTTVAGGATGAAGVATAAETAAALTTVAPAAGLATAAETAAALTTAAAPAAAASTGVMGAIEGAGAWMAANPMATMVGGQMMSSAFAPNQTDEQLRLEEERRKGSNIAGISGTGEGSPISLGLIQQAQQQDLKAPTYNYQPGARNG